MIPIVPQFREISIADRYEFSAAIAEHPPGISELTFKPDRDNFDYLYLQEELASLPGRRFMNKLNHANQFERQYQYDFTKLSAEHLPGCLALLNTWCEIRHCAADMGLSGEERAIQEAIEHFEELAITGGAILLNGQVQAFSLGEPLSADTVIIHFEKGNSEMPGIYQVINRDFCRIAWAGFKFINREQDLGIPGLRRAKESYNPVSLVPKYRVRVNIPRSSDQPCRPDLEPVK